MFVWIVSAVLGSSLLSLQSPKLYTDTGTVFDATVEEQVTHNENVHFSPDEIAQLNVVLQQKSLESSLAGSVLGSSTQEPSQKGPGGITDGLQTWIRYDKNEIQPLQVKTVQKTHVWRQRFFDTNHRI